MPRSALRLALAVAAATFFSAAATAKEIHIDIRKLVFEPANIEAAIGDTIEWTNHDIVAHSATARDKSWEVTLPLGATGSYVLQTAGAIDYFCRFHPNMRGRIEVVAP